MFCLGQGAIRVNGFNGSKRAGNQSEMTIVPKRLFSLIIREWSILTSFYKLKQSIVYSSLQFLDDYMKVFEERDLNIGAVMKRCCIITIFRLIRVNGTSLMVYSLLIYHKFIIII